MTALALLGVDLPARLEFEPIHVNTPVNRARPVLPGVIPHRYADVHVVDLDGVRVVGPVAAWIQAATRLRGDELIEVGDALTRRTQPLCRVEDLVDAVDRIGRRRGAKGLRGAIPWVRPRTDSPPETRTRLVIVRAGLPEPDVNVDIRDGTGRLLAIGDLVFARWKILIEHDGEYHFATPEQARRDQDRLARLRRAGWIVLHVHVDTLRDPQLFLADLRAAIATRAR